MYDSAYEIAERVTSKAVYERLRRCYERNDIKGMQEVTGITSPYLRDYVNDALTLLHGCFCIPVSERVQIEHAVVLRRYLTKEAPNDLAIWNKLNNILKERRHWTPESLLSDLQSELREYCERYHTNPASVCKAAYARWKFIREKGIVRRNAETQKRLLETRSNRTTTGMVRKEEASIQA